MEEESIFLDHVGDSPHMRLLLHFIEGRDFDYTLTDMLDARVSWGTLHRLIPKLLTLGIVVKTRKIGRATLYKINRENTVAKQLIALYDALLLDHLKTMEREILRKETAQKARLTQPIPT